MSERTNAVIVERFTLVCGALGLVGGFVWGLFVYIPTAWAAAFEIGIPATAVGALLGLAAAGVRRVTTRSG